MLRAEGEGPGSSAPGPSHGWSLLAARDTKRCIWTPYGIQRIIVPSHALRHDAYINRIRSCNRGWSLGADSMDEQQHNKATEVGCRSE
jgi:hypothetical protein